MSESTEADGRREGGNVRDVRCGRCPYLFLSRAPPSLRHVDPFLITFFRFSQARFFLSFASALFSDSGTHEGQRCMNRLSWHSSAKILENVFRKSHWSPSRWFKIIAYVNVPETCSAGLIAGMQPHNPVGPITISQISLFKFSLRFGDPALSAPA